MDRGRSAGGMIGAWILACTSAPPAEPQAASVVAAAPAAPSADVPVVAGPDLVGVCDASAAAAVGRYLVVADDERNVLRVFDWSGDTPSAAPADPIDLAPLSPLLADKKEADLEGMATMPDGTVWITASHDAGKDTDRKPNRQRLFALRLAERPEGGVSAQLAAGPTPELIEKGQNTNALYGIVVNTVGKTSKDPLGLSIEGLAAGPSGALLFGFRNPVHAEKALIERLENPAAFVGGAEPEITGPRWLKLGGAGIRSLEADGDGFRLISGPSGDGDGFSLWRWSGFETGTAAERLPVSFGDLHPEALVKVGEAWWVLSDDGTRKIGGTECKDLPEGQRRTRTARVP